MTISGLGLGGYPVTAYGVIANKAPADYPAIGTLIEEFDLWRPGYAGALVYIYRAGSTELAPVFTDPKMTTVAVNPHTLMSYTDGSGQEYGKFTVSLYTPYAYELDINASEQTGVQRIPLLALDGEDASNADVKADGSSRLRTLKDRFADWIHAEDYGEIGSSATTNTATINAAISAAAADGAGVILLPEGTIPFNSLTISTGIVLKGKGLAATTLTSTESSNVVTSSGDRSGFSDLTLDGVELNTNSVGWYSKNKNNLVADNVLIKRFDTGVKHIGGSDHTYHDFSVDNCVSGFRGLGDSFATGTNDGAEFSGMFWFQGNVTTTTSVGVDLAVVDSPVRHNTLAQVDFESNIGSNGALYMYGAQHLALRQCRWKSNTTDIKIADNPDTTLTYRQCQGLRVEGGQIDDGTIQFDGLCQDFIFNQVEFKDVTFALNVPDNQILFLDTTENNTTITGSGVKLSRARLINDGNIKGDTTDATVTVVWKTTVNPNEVVLVEVKATAEQTNGSDFAVYHITHAFRCAPATLNYDEQTANFTVGDVITGTTSAATAVVAADSDSGTYGVLSLASITGTFVDNELITGATSGSARVNGVITLGDVAEIGTETTIHSAGSNAGAVPAAWSGVNFAVSEQEAQITVAGAASTNISWNIGVNLTVL